MPPPSSTCPGCSPPCELSRQGRSMMQHMAPCGPLASPPAPRMEGQRGGAGSHVFAELANKPMRADFTVTDHEAAVQRSHMSRSALGDALLGDIPCVQDSQALESMVEAADGGISYLLMPIYIKSGEGGPLATASYFTVA
jgi:hypothetical protein